VQSPEFSAAILFGLMKPPFSGTAFLGQAA